MTVSSSPIASPSNLTEPVKILSTATTILCDDVSPTDSCKLDSFFASITPERDVITYFYLLAINVTIH